MFRTRRSLAGGLIAALTTVGLVATGTSFGTAGTTSADLPPVVGIGKSHIVGVVVDQGGRKVDAVTVRAIDEDSGEVVASSYTYAKDDDTIQHGYFDLRVRAGSYKVRLSKPGYLTHTLRDVGVDRRDRVNLGNVRLQKALAATRTTGKLKDATITTAERARVVVTVASGAPGQPTGKVRVKAGRSVLGVATLQRSHAGRVVVTLDRLRKGSYTVRASYAGNVYLKASESAKLGLSVRKARR